MGPLAPLIISPTTVSCSSGLRSWRRLSVTGFSAGVSLDILSASCLATYNKSTFIPPAISELVAEAGCCWMLLIVSGDVISFGGEIKAGFLGVGVKSGDFCGAGCPVCAAI